MSDKEINDVITRISSCSIKENILPIKIDCKNLREERQKENNKILLELIKGKNKNQILLNCNKKELDRILIELSISFDMLLDKCNNSSDTNLYFAKLLSRQISKNASRQGTKDEAYILDKCNITSQKMGITIDNLPTTAFRPTKLGKIVNKLEYDTQNLQKHDCLKSFDAKISGKCKGWLFAKMTYDSGGHQDNVFEETYQMCEWFVKYGDKDELYVILIDTNLDKYFMEIKNKFHKNNLIVVNHIEFQEYLIANYS